MDAWGLMTPRNIRTKTPRPPLVRARQPLGHTYRWGMTPTPGPVAVDVASELVEDEVEAPVEPPRRGGLRWLLAAFAIAACFASALGFRQVSLEQLLELPLGTDQAAAVPTPMAPTKASEPKGSPGWLVKHDGHIPVDGGVMFLPQSFDPAGSEYDLIVHFHGNTAIVKESVEHSRLNAVLAVINVGVLSDAYRQHFQVPGRFEKLLAQIESGLRKRGMAAPKLRRLALTSWSAGYGAIETILERRDVPEPDPLDAVIALDGVHAGYENDDPRSLKRRSYRAFVRAARSATLGQLMLSLTHSEITPAGYASSQRTQRAILAEIGVAERKAPMLPVPAKVALAAAKGAAPEEVDMVPIADIRAGMLRVQGFEGNSPSHHAAHLTQMAAIALPDLVARWAAPPAPATPFVDEVAADDDPADSAERDAAEDAATTEDDDASEADDGEADESEPSETTASDSESDDADGE